MCIYILYIYLYIYTHKYRYCLFVYWNLFSDAFLAIKIKSYLYISYMHLFDYIRTLNITYITYLNTENEM